MSKQLKKKFIRNCYIIVSFLIISLLSVYVLYHTHTLFGAGDMRFHFKRIIELKTSFEHGEFFPHFAFNQFHGSAVLFLYPYINLIPVIIGSFFIKSWITLIYLFFAFNTFVSLIISFYSSKYFSRSYLVSYLFSMVYSLSAPFMNYYFGNMDFGVSTTLAFLPAVIFGFIYLFSVDDKRWLLLPIGITLLIYSHVLNVIIITGFIFLWLIINIKSISKKIVKRINYSIILVILLTSIVWMPAINVVSHNIGNIKPLNAPNLVGIKFISLLKASLLNYPNFCLGLFAILGLFLSIICYKDLTKWTKQMFWMSVAILLLCSDIIPWSKLTSIGVFKLLKEFQFMYRFYVIPEIFLCYLFAVGIKHVCDKKLLRKYTCIIFITVILLAIFSQICMQKSINYFGSDDSEVTYTFIHNHLRNIKEMHTLIHGNHIKPIYVKDYADNFPSNNHIGYANPKYKLVNSHQVELLCSANFYGSASLDYYPMNSAYKENSINNNKAEYKGNKYVPLRHIGFNKYELISNKRDKVLLPFLIYNNENITLFRNSRRASYKISKYDLPLINVRRGKNIFYIKSLPNIYINVIEAILFILGLVLLSCLY